MKRQRAAVKVVELNDEELAARCIVLNKSITWPVQLPEAECEKDKLTVATLVTTRILVDNDLLPAEDVSYLFPQVSPPGPGQHGSSPWTDAEALWSSARRLKTIQRPRRRDALGQRRLAAWFDRATPG